MRTMRLWVSIGLMAVVLAFPVAGWSAQDKSAVGSLSRYDPKQLVFVANRDSNDVAVIDSQTDEIVSRIALGNFANGHMAMLTNDGKKLLVSATGKDRFLIIDLATLTIERTVATGRSPEHFDITSDDRLAYVGNIEDSTVSVIDLQDGKELHRLAGFFEPHGFNVMPDGSKVYVSNFGAHQVGVVSVPRQQLAKRLAVGDAHRFAVRDPGRYLSQIKGIANPTLTMDGKFAYAADGDGGELAVIDTRTDRVVTTFKVGEEPWRAYASPDGRWMLVPNNGDETVSVISTATHKVVTTLKGGREMTGINFVQGGKKAYVISSGDSTVYVYDMQGFRLLNRLKIGTNLALETASTTADGNRIYLASSTDDSVYVIDGATDQVKRIANVGRYPWAVTILGAASPNYCH
ncbi:Cytochrome D1 heme domain protein [Candidatus Methylomirabilis lanthanidiphila]|uniref:Cytochrome D1 heme domain protein n=1 Tax=Candidatus Methylomirabilis lanthanidiphila TaxID=2211376 RepID=A0A564ZGN1_9BACT|nr:beta-propeller fold lactonase family protein [Candidatus Methylomirabilis lanthanidiphila]VUZ84286.1 Cytochrome D1 heme domain protein [Candidatus Methylomirabilis lanthanidiphila]